MNQALSMLACSFVLLAACGGNGSSAGQDGGNGDDAGLPPSAIAGTWMGPVRLSPCSDLVALPGVTSEAIVSTVKLVIDTQGTMSAFELGGQAFFVTDTDPNYPDLTVHPEDPTLVSISFDAMPKDVETGVPAEPFAKAIHGGGLILDLDGAGDAHHAFVYLHDTWGCDIVVGVAQKGANSVAIHTTADFGGDVWKGFSAQYTDFTPPEGLPLDLRLDGMMQDWELQATGGTVTSGTVVHSGKKVVVESGDVTATDGYFEGTLQVRIEPAPAPAQPWIISGFMTTDQKFFAGFAYPEQWDSYWHDVVLIR